MFKNPREHLFIQLFTSRAIGSGRGRRDLAPLDGGVGLKLADHFLAASVCIKHLTKKGPEGIRFREKPPATHGPVRLRIEKRAGDKIFKDLADLLERLFLQQSYFFGKFLLG